MRTQSSKFPKSRRNKTTESYKPWHQNTCGVVFCKQTGGEKKTGKMMPVKEVLEARHLETLPPVLVIDETTIKCTTDAGPICGCDEKYDVIKNYKPFLPGGVNPYNRRQIPDSEDLEVFWKRLRIGQCDLIFDKPQAVHPIEIPENVSLPKEPTQQEHMLLRKPKYTEAYLTGKMRQCKREHSDGCYCPGK